MTYLPFMAGKKILPGVFPILLMAAMFAASCNNNDYTPKPRGYFRIQLPAKQYRLLDSIYPYTFEYPVYARISPDPMALQETSWINLEFPQFRGKLHISFKKVENLKELDQFMEDSRKLALKHIPKASGIEQTALVNTSNKVFGLGYTIKGVGAASPYQFYLTDSTRHFLRGAMYFDAVPNSDSLQPVIEFVQKDIDHLINTLRWK